MVRLNKLFISVFRILNIYNQLITFFCLLNHWLFQSIRAISNRWKTRKIISYFFVFCLFCSFKKHHLNWRELLVEKGEKISLCHFGALSLILEIAFSNLEDNKICILLWKRKSSNLWTNHSEIITINFDIGS